MNTQGIAILGSTGSIGCNTMRVVESFRRRALPRRRARRGAQRRAARRAGRAPPAGTRLGRDGGVRRTPRGQNLRARGVGVPRIEVGRGGARRGRDARGGADGRERDGRRGRFRADAARARSGQARRARQQGDARHRGRVDDARGRRSGAELLPVDSEHNALHQCLRGERREEVRRLILTASGGPFRDEASRARWTRRRSRRRCATRPGAWARRSRSTRATLMNKGLEVIEAHWLFGFGAGRDRHRRPPRVGRPLDDRAG